MIIKTITYFSHNSINKEKENELKRLNPTTGKTLMYSVACQADNFKMKKIK